MPKLKLEKLYRTDCSWSSPRVAALFLAILFQIIMPAIAEDGDVVRIVSTSKSGARTGTGFCFDGAHQTVATCYHCIDSADVIQVIFKNDIYSTESSAGRRVEIVGVDPDDDLAVLRLFGSGMKAFHILDDADSIQKILQAPRSVTIQGYPNDMGQTEFEGRTISQGWWPANRIRGSKAEQLFPGSDVPLIPFDVTVGPGNSGGPVLADGDVIGILAGSLEPGLKRTVAWALPASHLSPSVAA